MTIYTDADTVRLTLTPASVQADVGAVNLKFTFTALEYIHVCKPRFGATLLEGWDADLTDRDFVASLNEATWLATLVPAEVVANYPC